LGLKAVTTIPGIRIANFANLLWIVWSPGPVTAIDLLLFYGSADCCVQSLLNNKYV